MCDQHCRGHEQETGDPVECCPQGGWVRGFMQPRLLLLLLQKPSHGYELLERLTDGEGGPGVDPGLLYRTLRQMEREGWVRSSWDIGGSGPARRLYQVTDEGIELLHAWAARVRHIQRQLAEFLQAYQTYFSDQER